MYKMLGVGLLSMGVLFGCSSDSEPEEQVYALNNKEIESDDRIKTDESTYIMIESPMGASSKSYYTEHFPIKPLNQSESEDQSDVYIYDDSGEETHYDMTFFIDESDAESDAFLRIADMYVEEGFTKATDNDGLIVISGSLSLVQLDDMGVLDSDTRYTFEFNKEKNQLILAGSFVYDNITDETDKEGEH